MFQCFSYCSSILWILWSIKDLNGDIHVLIFFDQFTHIDLNPHQCSCMHVPSISLRHMKFTVEPLYIDSGEKLVPVMFLPSTKITWNVCMLACCMSSLRYSYAICLLVLSVLSRGCWITELDDISPIIVIDRALRNHFCSTVHAVRKKQRTCRKQYVSCRKQYLCRVWFMSCKRKQRGWLNLWRKRG